MFKAKHKRKTSGRVVIPNSALEKAMLALTVGNKSYAVVADKSGISVSTLKRKLNKFKEGGNQLPPPKTHCRRVFTDQQEKSIAQLISELKNLGIKIRVPDVCKIAYGFACKQNLQEKITAWKHQEATHDWLNGFVLRNPRIKNIFQEARKINDVEIKAAVQNVGGHLVAIQPYPTLPVSAEPGSKIFMVFFVRLNLFG